MKLSDSYAARLDALLAGLAHSHSDAFRGLLQTAVQITQQTLPQVERLTLAAQRAYSRDSELLERRMQQHERRLGKQQKELADLQAVLQEPALDPTRRAAAELKLKMLRAMLATDVSLANTDIFRLAIESKTRAATALSLGLFRDILQPDETQFQHAAAIEGINVAIGAVPLAGNVYSALLGIYNISTSRKRMVRIADKQAAYLEDYTRALRAWFAATEAVMRALEPVAE